MVCSIKNFFNISTLMVNVFKTIFKAQNQSLLVIFLLSVFLNRTILALICYRCRSSDASLGGSCNLTLGNPVPSSIKACISNGTCVTFQNPYDNNGIYGNEFISIFFQKYLICVLSILSHLERL
jgi:hypothetical protein